MRMCEQPGEKVSSPSPKEVGVMLEVVTLPSTSACKSGAESGESLWMSHKLGSRAMGSHSFPLQGEKPLFDKLLN